MHIFNYDKKYPVIKTRCDIYLFFVTFYDFTKWIENGCYIMSYFFESILLQIKSNLILVDGNIIIVDEKVQND